jgi:hypothetical protein
VLPKNARSEATARRWAASGHATLRAHALAVLSNFQSDRNAELLKTMLTDPAFVEDSHGVWRVRYYFLRQQAHSVLTGWGVQVPAPICEESPCGYAAVGWRESGTIGALLLPTLALGFVARRRRASLGVSGAAACICTALSIGIGALWVRSDKHVDEVLLTRADRHRIASTSGGLLYARLRDWRGPTGFVRGGYRRRWLPQLDLFPDMTAAYDTFDPATGWVREYRKWIPGAKPSPQVDTLTGGFVSVSGMAHNALGQDSPYRAIFLPYGYVLAALLWLPLAYAAWVVRERVRARRLARQCRCVSCGYDLRASPHRCPECGQPVACAPPATDSRPETSDSYTRRSLPSGSWPSRSMTSKT